MENSANNGKDVNPELLEELEDLVKIGALSNEKLKSFLSAARNKNNRKEKQKKEKMIAGNIIPYPTMISYQESLKVWGENNMETERTVPEFFFNRPSSDEIDKFNWVIMYLNGFSFLEIQNKYPDKIFLHNPERYPWIKQCASPGYYLVSVKNILLNLPLQEEDSLVPANSRRLTANLVLEIFLTLEKLGKLSFGYYLRTDSQNRHYKFFCVGKRGDSFALKPFNGGKRRENIIPCLEKFC
ncbi:MAG: hypothetical protein WC146_01245 [Patescibacteria group bacterium]